MLYLYSHNIILTWANCVAHPMRGAMRRPDCRMGGSTDTHVFLFFKLNLGKFYRHKMNDMKKKWLVCALCMLSVGFVSCSDDDDDKNGGDGGLGSGSGQPAVEAPAVSGAGIQFPVTSFSEGGTPELYYYTDGKMTGGSDGDDYSFQITSNPLQIKATYMDSRATDTYYNIKVNNSGFITYCDFRGAEEDGGYIFNSSTTCTYDGNGYLLSEKSKGTDNEGYSVTVNMTNTWENGNLVRREENVVEKEDGETYNFRIVYDFVYDTSKYPNSGVFYDINEYDDYFFESYIFYAGLLGRISKNIPIRSTCVEYENGVQGDAEVTEISNVFYNPNGSIKTIVVKNGSSFNYGYDPVTPDRSVKSVPVAGKTMKSNMLRRLQERRAK